MRTLLLCSALLLGLASAVTAAPALGDKPPKWEYAELTYRTIPGRPGGVDADGKEVAATPASVSVRWISGAGEVDVKGWDELADKLKAPSMKKGSAAYLKIQILNYLGSGGGVDGKQTAGSAAAMFDGLRRPRPRWRARDPRAGTGGGADFPGFRASPATGTWLLKRRVP